MVQTLTLTLLAAAVATEGAAVADESSIEETTFVPPVSESAKANAEPKPKNKSPSKNALSILMLNHLRAFLFFL